ncbi:Oligopeptide ABC transporter, ATP-binding protein OppF (TC 3.A.1.5.1) [Olavius algarvensis Delta 1 endosymbiont]|nr:Oligopeptide ABC transporter, ATP-binding protein OppF (TC 3.A.1.5.1) [Olavius algarvensis Delta 1 endosymbiont]
MTTIIETKDLKKYFQIDKHRVVHATDGLSLTIGDNEIVGLVGESGSGKSTFGKVVVGLHDKTSGEVWYKGELTPQRFTPADYKRYSTEMQMIFQDPYSSLNPRMTVLEIIGEGLYLQGGFSKADIKERVAEWLRRVGLQPDHMSRYCHEFSGGQRQRIGIARALVLEPKFVVCDEPISALDVSVQAQVVNLLGEFRDTLGISLLFIAHDLSMVRYVSDRIAVMYLGAMVEVGLADEVFFHPKHPYTRLLIASNPEADPEYERNHAHVPIKGEIPSPINIPPGCRFAGRCPEVMDKCRQVTPEMIMLGPSQGAACLLYI